MAYGRMNLEVCGLEWNRHHKKILSEHGFSNDVLNNQLCLWQYPSLSKIGGIPLGVTEDRLIGGSVDVEDSVKSRTTVFQPDLAEVQRGVRYDDVINLLDEGISNLLLNVLTEGIIIMEREGISVKHPCKPLFVATYNPEEGAVREHLLDRVAINLSAGLPMSCEDLVAAVGVATQYLERPDDQDVLKMVEDEIENAKTRIVV